MLSAYLSTAFGQDQTLSGNLTFGITDGLGYGPGIFMNGNTDPSWIRRFNAAYNQSELRVDFSDDAQGDDSFVVGYTYWEDQQWHPCFTVINDGSVGIGTRQTTGYRLAVNGGVKAKEVRVESANWPDYVFNQHYKKLTLIELKKFIHINQHLPEIPSAKQVQDKGIQLGEMNNLLLKKVEELTLYLIEQNDRIIKLEEQNEVLRQRVNLNSQETEKN